MKLGDWHRFTLYHDADFHRYMDQTSGDGWRDWPYAKARAYAKAWNHGQLHGMGGPAPDAREP